MSDTGHGMDINTGETLLDRVRRTGADPSAEEWEIELRRVCYGERDYILRRGSPASYAAKILSLAKDQAVAQTNFRIALSNVVQMWQPLRSEADDYYVACLLDLIGAYRPREGFLQLVGFMQHGMRFERIPLSRGGYGAGQDLHMKALVSLEYYYPSAEPASKDEPDFESYVQVLQSHTEDAEYGSYAVGRLMSLNVLRAEDPKMRGLIRPDGGVLEEIIAVTLSPTRRLRVERDLTYIYTHCFINGPETRAAFEQVLKQHKAAVENYGSQLRVRVPGHEELIKLDLPEEFMLEVFDLEHERGIEGAKEIARQAASAGGNGG